MIPPSPPSEGLLAWGEPYSKSPFFKGDQRGISEARKHALAPQARDCSLGGNKNQFAAKSPPSEGLLARGI
ncbi:hypothetical protein LYNGBM3L_08960 [Moorena producens 3L]|uniref:Uncharacterized protein n=1 Tax=Moorena producens 3L TaxID=489825 RepID=F4XJX2_9CYAN|nr:hypothetical protein LYNGBM3L_08960 [Moorena producens 3L]OLT65404.1 hypothetical protein BI334_10415 [Moorena producens 3L]